MEEPDHVAESRVADAECLLYLDDPGAALDESLELLSVLLSALK